MKQDPTTVRVSSSELAADMAAPGAGTPWKSASSLPHPAVPRVLSKLSALAALGTIAVCMIMTGTAHAQSPQQVFDQASQYYQQARFVQARDAWESLVKAGYVGGEVYYNLGNAYYKSGNIARAILSYERALKYTPNDEDLRHNLQLANLMITDRLEATPRLFIWDWWDDIKSAFSLRGLTWVTYALFFVTILAFVGVVLARTYRLRRVSFMSGAVSLLLFVLFLTIFIGKVTAIGKRDAAVVVVDITTVKNSPDAKGGDAFVLHGGVKVQITDKVNEWVKIRLTDGKVGWMESTAAEII